MMNRLLLSAAFATLFAAPAFADVLHCQITAARDETVFSNYIGGTVTVDLDSAVTMLEQAGNVLQVISRASVASYKAHRDSCIFGTETVTSGGDLRAMKLKFNECTRRDDGSSLGGYVHADVSFDLHYGVGKYRELFRTPRGPVPSAWVDFEKCELTRSSGR